MSARNSTPPAATSKPVRPEKPSPGFPLFPHANGSWAKKIRGELHYFGGWSDPEGALENYNRQKEDLHAGRRPREVSKGGVEVRDLCNHFWNTKNALVEAGELSPRTMQDYSRTTDLIAEAFGNGRRVDDLGPDDFAELRQKMAKKWGPHMLAKIIQCVRSVFKHGYEAGMIATPMRFGPGFKRPTKKTMRLERKKHGPKLFTAEECRRIIDAADQPLRTMFLLALNCAFGNADCGRLPMDALDLDGGWATYAREKTGVDRRAKLWPETIASLRDWLKQRPAPKDDALAGIVFITKYGGSWFKDTSDNPISKEVAKLLHDLGINGRKGLGFYTLRHVFRTVADESRDQPAVDHVMGHESPHMSSVYRERISDERLAAVAEHVRRWLWPSSPSKRRAKK